MSKRKRIRIFLSLALCLVMALGASTTAFAYSEGDDPDLPPVYDESDLPNIGDDTPADSDSGTAPDNETPDNADAEATEPPVTGEAFEDEGNAYTRDLLYDKDCHKQFITVTTKNGNTFYIVIDYDKPVDEDEEQYQTYFLNLVDERDLMALLEDEDLPDTSCTCVDKCAAGAVNTDCAVCKNNMSECTGKAAEQEPTDPAEGENPEQPDEPEKEKSGGASVGLIAVIVLLAVVGGGAYYYIKFVRGKKQKDEDLDFFDDDGYEDGPYVNEDEDKEPDIADDEDDEETEVEGE